MHHSVFPAPHPNPDVGPVNVSATGKSAVVPDAAMSVLFTVGATGAGEPWLWPPSAKFVKLRFTPSQPLPETDENTVPEVGQAAVAAHAEPEQTQRTLTTNAHRGFQTRNNFMPIYTSVSGKAAKIESRMTRQIRIEHDSLGSVEVPAEHLWGAQTQRSIENFPIGIPRFRWGRAVIRALGVLKKCAALANAELKQLPQDRVDLIVRAAQEVIDGKWDSEFPLVVFQTGSGTQSNMNANEVIANRAIQLAGGVVGSQSPIHPNDDVNRSQSSNDAFPTVMHIATVDQITNVLLPSVTALRDTLAAKSAAYADIVMIGRTHLQDATPITLGQIISGWVAQLDQAMLGIERALPPLYELAIGGTAVGTGLNAHPRFGETAARKIAEETARPFISAPNKFAALSAHDAMVTLSGAIRTLAGALMKIANDVRWHASGPRAGLGELTIPDNEPGSSIMPGKINPTQCEALTQVAVQVFGNDHAVAFAGSQGNFQLNVYKPVILHNVLESIELLADATHSFDERCARGIEPDEARIRQNLESSLMLVTALNPHIGYEKSAKIALAAYRDGTSLREAAIKSGFVTAEEFAKWVNPRDMV
jgi:fumarate hydratase, class II